METGNEVLGFESGNRGHIDRAFFRRGNMQGCVHDFRAELLVMIPKLRAFARLLSCDTNEAEELSLKVVAEAWRSPPAFGLETNLKAWLFAIARNEFHANRRYEQREAPVEQVAPDTSGIMRALRLLPDAFREALILVVAGGCSYREAAKICGCPVGTVKSRVFRARQALVADFHTMPAV